MRPAATAGNFQLPHTAATTSMIATTTAIPARISRPGSTALMSV